MSTNISITFTFHITPEGITFSTDSEAAEDDEAEPSKPDSTSGELRVLPGGVGFQLHEPEETYGTYAD